MSKKEFLQGLEQALLENMDYSEAVQHIRYYSDYIDSEVDKGRDEKEVVASLQSPRLVAKNIINNSYSANKYDNNIKDHSGRKNDTYRNYNEEQGVHNGTRQKVTFSVNGKPVDSIFAKLIAILIIIVVAVVVIAIVGGILWLIAKVILPLAVIGLIIGIVVKIISEASNK